jgi:hypothetical protein
MGMYVSRPPLTDTHDLNQGDLLVGVLRPKIVGDSSFVVREGPKANPVKPEARITLDAKLRVISPLEVVDALVISNSCDNVGDAPLLLVPIRPFKFTSASMTDADRWAVISQAATGTANPKLFYLPASKETGPAVRSEVQLNLLFSVSHEYLAKCVRDVGTKRIGGLTPEAVRHLQWAFGVVFSRDPREDDDWPSDEDLPLKLSFLEQETAKGGPFKEKYEGQRDRLKAALSAQQAELRAQGVVASTQPQPAPNEEAPIVPQGPWPKVDEPTDASG